MKKVLWTAVLALALMAGRTSMAAGSFEGEVDMQMTVSGGDKTVLMKYFVKGQKLRTQVDSPDGKFSGGTIFNFPKHEIITVMDKQKMYSVSKYNPENFGKKNDTHFKMHKAGSSETILGYSCEEWDYESDNSRGKIWFAQGIGNWWGTSMAAQSSRMDSAQRAMVNMIVAKKMFPMKYEIDKESGKGATMVVVKIEKQSLDAAMFEAPAGYKKLDMGALGLGGGSGDGKKPTKEDIMKMIQQYKQ